MHDDTRAPDVTGPAKHLSYGEFVRRCVTAVVIAALAFLAWQLRHMVVVAFAAVVVAAILAGAGQLVRKALPVGHGTAVAGAGVAILFLLGVVGWFIWPQVQTQSSELLTRVPQALDALEQRFGIDLPESISDIGLGSDGLFGRIWGDVFSMAGTVFSALTGLVLVVVAGAFLASSPSLYRDGMILLVPREKHARAREALNRTGRGLELFLVGQIISMSIVGTLVGLGAWALGLPSPLALGLVAFLTEFIPLIGPIIGAVPGLLLASTMGWSTFLWALLLYVAVQQVESNLITPLVQRHMVTVPPALFMLSVVAMGALFGVVGVILAGPLTVALFVLVRTLYVEGALDETLDHENGV